MLQIQNHERLIVRVQMENQEKGIVNEDTMNLQWGRGDAQKDEVAERLKATLAHLCTSCPTPALCTALPDSNRSPVYSHPDSSPSAHKHLSREGLSVGATVTIELLLNPVVVSC